MSKSLEVDIYIGGKGFCIKKIPSKKISDFNIDKKGLQGTLKIRQCGVQFCELTDDQISNLDDFMQQSVDRRSGKDRRQFDDPGYSGDERRTWIDRRTGPLLS